jgi:general secretion pathway protein A
VLEEIRLLANVQDSRGTLLQIVLVGQPSLGKLLDAPELAQLRQRIARFISLDSLSDEEVKQYIAHRLTVARETPTSSGPVTFADDAVSAVARLSRGNPRIVNLVCDRALENAYAEQSRTVSAAHVSTAASQLQLPSGENQSAAAMSPAAIAGPAATSVPVAIEEAAATEPAAAAPDAARPPRRRGVTAAAAVVFLAAAAWIGSRAMRPSPIAEPPPATTTSTAPPATAPPRAPDLPPSAAAPAEQRPTAAPPGTTPPGGESVEILVASFRTEARATEVAGQIAAMGLKVRQRSTGGWQQVLTGPFPSKEAAGEAQQQLSRSGFTETVLVRENR